MNSAEIYSTMTAKQIIRFVIFGAVAFVNVGLTSLAFGQFGLPPGIQIQRNQIRQPMRLPQLDSRYSAEAPQAPLQIELPAQTPASEKELNQLEQDLGSTNFQVRSAASKRLSTLPREALATLAERLLISPSAEALVRIHSELVTRYRSTSRQECRTASDLMEKMAAADRLLSSDPANHVLKQYWQTRMEVALEDLREMGAIVRVGVFSVPSVPNVNVDHRPSRQVLLTEKWTGGEAGLDVFRRLRGLTGPHRGLGGMNVYLLTGHSLSDEQIRTLSDIVGDNRVQERSRVALGITQHMASQAMPTGVLVGSVSKGGAAEKAGLNEGDLILSIHHADEEVEPIDLDVRGLRRFGAPLPDDADRDPAMLRDFEDLVQRLKVYRNNEEVQLQVLRNVMPNNRIGFGRLPLPPGPQNQPREVEKETKIEVIKVKLIGWEELPMMKGDR